MSSRPPLRILYVSHSFPLPDAPLSNIGGMQRVAVGLHAALQRHPDVELDEMVLRTSWKDTGMRTPGFLYHLLRTLPARIRAHRADVVLFSSMVTASVTLLLRDGIKEAGARTAVIPVGRDVTLPNPVYQFLVPRILRRVDLIFPISRATAATCTERGAHPYQVHVVPCGVDLPPRPEPGARAEGREQLLAELGEMGQGVRADQLLLLSVGRHQERKGFHWFVGEVMPRLSERAVYLLAGDGPMTDRIRQAAEGAGVADRVRMLGRVSEERLARLYQGADLFIMPNIPVPGDIEGFGVVMLEAGAVGLPVIAADLEGIADVIQTGENGVLVPSRDAAAFVDAIERLGESYQTLESWSFQAAHYVHSRFGWDAVADEYVSLLWATASE